METIPRTTPELLRLYPRPQDVIDEQLAQLRSIYLDRLTASDRAAVEATIALGEELREMIKLYRPVEIRTGGSRSW